VKHIVTFLLLTMAIVFYALGAVGPGTAFLVIGALLEGAFWYRILRRKRT
jgi:hypothetical protein